MGAGCTNIFINTIVNEIEYYSPGFDCINLASTAAAGLSLVVSGCFSSNVGNGTSIPTGGALGESSDAYDELSSLGWNSSGRGNPKVGSAGGKSWYL